MIEVKQLYMKDIINAPYVDRLFYGLLNSVSLEYYGAEFLTINPLKWSIMTLIAFSWVIIFWVAVFPLAGIPCIFYDAYKLKDYKCSDGDISGWYQSNVKLLRELK